MQQAQEIHSAAEARVIRQLVEAILFECLLVVEEECKVDGSMQFNIYGKSRVFSVEGRKRAFDRYSINIKSLKEVANNLDKDKEKTMLQKIVHELPGDEYMKSQLLKELEQTIVLSEYYKKIKNRRLLSYEELESAVIEGHPYHPCFKARTNFSLQDHQMYGPEYGHSFQLQWIAVEKEKAQLLAANEESFWRDELGESVLQQLQRMLRDKGGSVKNYIFFPVHPWQWKKLLSDQNMIQLLKKKEIIPLGQVGDRYRATQSVRTLWNETNNRKAFVKLPINMVNTSSQRTIPVHSIYSARAISTWLRTIIKSDEYLSVEARLSILEEYGGVVLKDSPEIQSYLLDQLNVIWRQSVSSCLEEGEKAIPFTAISLMEEDSRPFINDWINDYGVEAWIMQLINVAIVPTWHLLACHGIAVEAHAQNMILVHREGWPVRIILRDFHESIEYNEEFLLHPHNKPNFRDLHPFYKEAKDDEAYWMSSIEALRELLMDTLFVFNLSEFMMLIEHYYGVSESNQLSMVDSAIESHLARFPEMRRRHAAIGYKKGNIYAESLLAKKLHREKGEFRHVISNPFATL
ncbi:IucA/IucC family protein [Bacillus suaedaesalsae]|uniref:Siderophore biosynthesis protein n=1 Tax=Bacillus suaedaesalsae TaxID=2810349 RepID=A0ABS2DKE9_9BACI|nr:IucA/IucC family protein [Bacillus suaedaesalsae]MBM6618938.1 siderophore biosynthesis protein [Bacillus suaedaesalsae]